MTWLRVEAHISWGHRLTVTMPMAALGLVDNLVVLLTLGYVHPGLSLGWGFRRTLFRSRKNSTSVDGEE